MLFYITTQYKENYGTADEPYWKFKGSDDYLIEVPGFNYQSDMAFKKAMMLIDEMRTKIEYASEYAEEYIVDWSFVQDSFQTEFEKSQLEFDGEILYPAKRISYNQLMESDNVHSC